ncbi:hypothetical protein ACJMK2_026495 [Sinanodonta woodiana]|uniref:Ig-like domain-containing protein n=1 Tax=Sinanodonta woodiana TaxID=1069815 RepID=A0ABD3XNG2_SINWO
MWESWSHCFCDTGTRTRHRQCNNPAPASGGSDCVGIRSEQSSCADQCPVDGNWGTWGIWSNCMCNTGTHNRTRECNNPLPARGGDDCFGDQYEQESCVHQCPGPGVWTEWTQWSACSTSCGSGFRYIARFCINPNTEKEKHDCVGHAVESQSCQVKQCSEATTNATAKPHVRLVPPEIFGSTEANVGGNVTLLCLTDMPGLILTWYYQENHPLPVGARHPMGTNELIITGVHSKNYGNYTCELSDSYQTVTTRVFINLRETSPAILSLIKSPDTLVEGAPVKINCNVLAFPEPVVRWGYKDRSGNSFVPPPVSYKEGGKEIDIDSFQSMLYGGTWTCSAVNKLGSDHRDITL